MIRVLLSFLIVATLSSGVSGQTAAVRSGEHEVYTRLAIKLPQRAEWEITKGFRQAAVSVSIDGLNFDTSDVFSRIPKTRLSTLSQPDTGGALILGLSCDCEVTGFVESGTLLVIDITDPSPKKQASAPLIVLPMNQQPYRYALAPRSTPRKTNKHLALPTITNTLVRTEPVNPVDPQEKKPKTRNVSINLSERRLLEQIERASDQGLLTPVVAIPINGSDKAPEEEMHGDKTGDSASLPPVRIAAETVVDRDISGVSREASRLGAKQECLSSQAVALPDWGDSRSFSEQVGEQRANLYSEFDKLNTEAALNLAKIYIYFGFGAEAQSVLALSVNKQPDQAVLTDLANLLDSNKDFFAGSFAGQQNCEGEVSLWAVLAEPDQARNARVDAVQQAFVLLPKHLRKHLGPKLSQIFTQIGKPEVASSILRSIDRAEDGLEPNQELATAALLQTQGKPEAAIDIMESVVETDSESSPAAIIELVELHWQERGPVSPEFPELVGAYAQEFRGSETGVDLRRAHSISLALSGQYDEAFTALREIRELDGTDGLRSATVPVLTLLSENADDVTFLKFALWQIKRAETTLPETLRESIARRTLNSGFPNAAFSILNEKGSLSASPTIRMLRARAAIELGRPHRALVELLGLPGPKAASLRALAMQRNGDHQLAGRAMLEAQMYGEAARSFWLADRSAEASETREGPYGHLAEISARLKREPPVSVELAPLASARSLLEDSEVTRGEINELLAAVAPTLEN